MFNAQSVVNKLCELHHILYSCNYDIVFITESWLHADISMGLLDPESAYCVLRKDRADTHIGVRGGGVCVFVNRNLIITEVTISEIYNVLELVCFDLLYANNRLRFFVVYRPPHNDDVADQYLSTMINCLTLYTSGTQSNIIVGDLNCPKIDWSMASCSGDHICKTVLKFTVESGFFQFVDFATRGDNILDVILADDDQIITAVAPDAPIGHSDHLMVKFKLTLENLETVKNSISSTPRYKWFKADFDAMQAFLMDVDWHSMIYYNPSVTAFWDVFTGVLHTAIDSFVPKHSGVPSVCRRRHYPLTLRKMTAKKRLLWKKVRDSGNDPVVCRQYLACAKSWRQELKCFDRQVESNIIDSNNLGNFYRYANKRLTYRRDLGVLNSTDGTAVVDDKEKATLFNNYFASVGVVDNNDMPVCNCVLNCDKTIDTIEFTRANVEAALSKLKNNLSSGPDGLPPVMFKRLKHCLAGPLALVFTQLLSVAFVPDIWKKAVITPVFKKGVAGNVCNYRPISLTCVPSKIMERIIAQQIYNHLSRNNILHHAQHGFCKGRSTCTNLLESFNDWTISIQYKHSVTIAYVDFSKAFDTVSHKKLFARLDSYGIRGNLLQWLCQFFSERTHQTRVGSSLSPTAELISGVVQGSGIGPLMFLIFINELAEILDRAGVKVKLFADDVKVYVQIIGSHDSNKLQCALDLLTSWAETWQLTISVDKCCILNIGRAKPPVMDFYIDGKKLPTNLSCRDLGVIVSHDLKPAVHIGQMVAKAHQRANIILRSFVSRDVALLVRAFTTYVRPIVEYNSIIWSPQNVCDIEEIERVQRRFTKRLTGLKMYSYAARLNQLKIPSLELRRLHIDLIMCYKIVFGLVDVKFDDFFQLSTVVTTRGHPFKLFKEHSDVNARKSFFSQRIINVWNSLPSDIVDFGSLRKFKRTIKLVDLSSFLKCF